MASKTLCLLDPSLSLRHHEIDMPSCLALSRPFIGGTWFFRWEILLNAEPKP